MDKKQRFESIFNITVEDLQDQALDMVGRPLTENELHIAKNCIESGLSFGIETVFKAAIEEAVDSSK